jgi:hypothetical protein
MFSEFLYSAREYAERNQHTIISRNKQILQHLKDALKPDSCKRCISKVNSRFTDKDIT